jgi:hypothetical protein
VNQLPTEHARPPLDLPKREEVVARIEQATKEASFLRRLLRLIESRDCRAEQRREASRA